MSRLSTALHAATAKASSAVTPVAELREDKHHPRPRLVLLTLIAVSVPVETVFLLCVVAFGWIHLPFLFMVLQILFFLIAVCVMRTRCSCCLLLTTNMAIGLHIARRRAAHHDFPLEAQARPRHVRPTHPVGAHRSRWSAPSGRVLRDRFAVRREGSLEAQASSLGALTVHVSQSCSLYPPYTTTTTGAI